MSQNILSLNNARNNDFDYTLTYGNMIYKNKEIQNVSIDDIVGSFAFQEQLSLDNVLSILYNHNDSYGERNFDKLNNDIYTNLNNIKNSNEFIDLIKIGDKYYVGQDGNHRVFYLINEYNKLKEQFKNDADKLSEIKKMFEIKCRVTKKLEFESINKICYALNKCWIDDIRISFPMDKEGICQVEYNGNIYLIKSEEEFLNFFKSYYESIEKGSDKYNKLTSALSNIGILNLSESIIKHPKSDELNELEKQKQIAKQNNDDVAYNYAQQCIRKIIRENRMQVSPGQWDSFTNEQKESYIQIKIREAKILNDKDEFNYWLVSLNNLKEKNVINSPDKTDSEVVSKTTLEELKNSIGNTDGYTILVHGTHLTDEEVKNLIFKEGLRTTGKNEETSLNYTTQPLDITSYSVEELREKFEKYDHNNRNMVIIRLPNDYFNVYDTTGDRECRKSRAFMKGKVQVAGGYKYVLDPKFIVGSYNTETMEITLNNSFEKELTNETVMTLKTNLANLYKELGIDPDYIESINSEVIIEVNEPLYNSAPVSNGTKNDYQEMIQEQEKKDYKYYYQELMKAVEKRTNLVNPTESEKKQIVGEIFYNQGFLVESLNTQQEFNEVMNSLVNDLNDNQLQKIILTDMQDRYNSLFKKQSDNLDNQQQIQSVTQEQTELTIFVNQLREKLNKVSAEYKFMLLDGYIDDVELATLISRTNELIDNANSLKPLANNQKEVMLLNSITEMLHNEQKRMIIMQNGIKNIEVTSRTL